MIREKLTTIIKEALKSQKYGLYTGFEYRIPSEKVIFPACWMPPMQLVRVDGRHEGKRTYKITLHLMKLNKKASEAEKERAWSTMEEEALEIIHHIGPQGEVYCIDKIEATPAEFSLSPHGEISLKVEFEVQVAFCNYPTEI